MKLQNLVTVVTGASQGLGRAIAEEFVKEGAHAAICARDGNMLETVRSRLEELATSGQRVLAFPGDVSSREHMQELFRRIEQEIGLVDVLVNNAGVYGPKGPSESVDLDEWSRALEINLLGTFIPTRIAIAQMKQKGGGKIINLSGGGATNPLPTECLCSVEGSSRPFDRDAGGRVARIFDRNQCDCARSAQYPVTGRSAAGRTRTGWCWIL
jgi:NAD(P)-dependent dehydrogenase (short-subunit alcohol dehydrogenase family)